MKHLSIDIETFSGTDLAKAGVYKYAEDPSFEVLLFGCSVDGGDVIVYDLASGDRIPTEILDALTDESVIKSAFNASFERVCLSRYIGLPSELYLNPSSWHCSMIWSAYMGLPLSLAGAGAVLNLEEQKLSEGKELVRYFCTPCAPTKSNGGRTRNRPADAPEQWERFKAYNLRDVQVEMQIQKKLERFPVPDFVWDEYHMSEEINDRGILVDMALVDSAVAIDQKSRSVLTKAMQELTDLDNPNSVLQMKEWLSGNGVETEDLGKKNVKALLKKHGEDAVGDALALRQQLAKSSVKKYTAMKTAACADNRCRGMFMFYGANRTGRFAGRIVQLQNLPQNHLSDLAEARALVRRGNYDDVALLYDNVPDVLSQLIRTAFIPAEGKKFIVADFSAIECRVLSWLAGEQWVLDAFAAGKDIYCAVASQMFHCNVVKNGENGHLRQKGKQATLSCGYGGSVNALIAMGALEGGMKEEELKPLVDAWRLANPNIVRLWRSVENAAMECIKGKCVTQTHGITFTWKSGMMFITLPSGRNLTYIKPHIGENRFGSESITYEGIDGSKKWSRLESFGGKLCENIVQAIARDILVYAMQTMRDLRIVAHVHDECIVEADMDMPLEYVCGQMGKVPPWAPGLILRADGYECSFYMKD